MLAARKAAMSMLPPSYMFCKLQSLQRAPRVHENSHMIVVGDAGSPFHQDNRMGIEGTLHRISAIRNRDAQHSVLGLTYRIGRHMSGQHVHSSSMCQVH